MIKAIKQFIEERKELKRRRRKETEREQKDTFKLCCLFV